MHLRLPMPPNLANARMHHMVKHRAKVAYWQHLDLLLAGKVIPPPPVPPLEKARLHVTMTLAQPMDDDNATARIKWAQDWLVRRGYVAGDSRRHLRLANFPVQRISRKNEPCLELTLEAA